MRSIKICLLMMLFLSATSVKGQHNLDIVLKKGKQAPFDGVLVSEDDYRELSSCEEYSSNLRGEYLELKYECNKLSEYEGDSLSKFVWFIVGIGIGFLGARRF